MMMKAPREMYMRSVYHTPSDLYVWMVGVEPTRPKSRPSEDRVATSYTTSTWYLRWESNPHARRHDILRVAWLPLHH